MNLRQSEHTLPTGFEPLETYVAAWALPTEASRYTKRISTPMSEVRAFYDAIYPEMDSVMRHLSSYPADDIAELPAATRRLYRLALAYFEVSHPVELKWAGVEPADAFPADRIGYMGPSQAEN